MHDLGVGDLARGDTQLEVEGADLVAALLTEHSVDTGDVDRVWEAIALHTSPGIAERRGLLAYQTREGVAIDLGRTRRSSRPGRGRSTQHIRGWRWRGR